MGAFRGPIRGAKANYMPRVKHTDHAATDIMQMEVRARSVTEKRGTLWAAILGSCIVFLDSTVVEVALPRIGHDLPAHLVGVLEGQSYVYNGYLLSESAFLILAGGLTDVYGRRAMFSLGLIGFGVSSLLSGLAPTLEWLVVFRVLQGLAGAVLVPGSLALITATFAGEEQGRAFGVWAGASAGLAILGPFVGGVLVDGVSWRAVFLLNVPLVLAALWLTSRYVREGRNAGAAGGFDVPGTLLTALAVGGLVIGTISGQQRQWQSPAAFAALGIGVAAAALLPFWMLRVGNPLVPPALFRSRNFTVTNLSTLVIYAALSATFYYLTLFLQGTLGYSAAATGVAMVPGALFMALFSPRFGALAARYGARWFMSAGPLLMAAGVLWLARIPTESPAWALRLSDPSTFLPPAGYLTDVLPGLVAFGLGAMLMVAPLTATLMASAPVEHAGVASAINTVISDVGPQLAVAGLFVAVTAHFYAALESHISGMGIAVAGVRHEVAPFNAPGPSVPQAVQAAAHAASAAALHLAMLVSAVLFLCGAVINAVGIRTPVSRTAARVVSPDPLWRRYCHLAAKAATPVAPRS
jgi:EmrB/QacA subfamily drug resistance transporter